MLTTAFKTSSQLFKHLTENNKLYREAVFVACFEVCCREVFYSRSSTLPIGCITLIHFQVRQHEIKGDDYVIFKYQIINAYVHYLRYFDAKL